MNDYGEFEKMKFVQDFIKKMQYEEDKAAEGIILYGSYQTKTNNIASDIDILVGYNDEAEKNIKGYTKVHDIEVEYYERSLKFLYARVKKDFANSEDTVLSAIGHGMILMDRSGRVAELQEFTLEVFKEHLPRLEVNEIQYLSKGINKAIKKLIYYTMNNSDYFTIYYSLTLEKIRVFYHKLLGCSSLTAASVYKIYTNKDLQKIQYKTMPPQEFVDLYLECISVNNKQKEEYLSKIIKLNEYAMRNLQIDFDNMRVELNGKNH